MKWYLLLNLFVFLSCSLAGSALAGESSYFYAGNNVLAVKGESVEYLYHDRLGTDTATRSLPFGEVLTDGQRFGFTGKEEDTSGLHYFGARYMESETGRFTSIDPVEESFPYQYVHNNPLMYIDPDGKEVVFADEAVAQYVVENLNTLFPSGDVFSYKYSEGTIRLTIDMTVIKNSDVSSEQVEIATLMSNIVDMEETVLVLDGAYYSQQHVRDSDIYSVVQIGVESRDEYDRNYYRHGIVPKNPASKMIHEFAHTFFYEEYMTVLYENKALKAQQETIAPVEKIFYTSFRNSKGIEVYVTPFMFDEAQGKAMDKFKSKKFDQNEFDTWTNFELEKLHNEAPEHFKAMPFMLTK